MKANKACRKLGSLAALGILALVLVNPAARAAPGVSAGSPRADALDDHVEHSLDRRKFLIDPIGLIDQVQ